MSAGSGLDGVAGGLYLQVVDAELDRQHDREITVRQRGAMVASAAGGLVTLILALAGVTQNQAATRPTSGAGKVLLDVGLGFFVIAALLGIIVNLPWTALTSPHAKYSMWVTTLADRDEWMRHDLAEVAREVAASKIKAFEQLRDKNDQRNWVLAFAIIAMSLATACLAMSVASSLR